MDDTAKRDLGAIKDGLMELFDRLAAWEIRNDPDIEDPGPVPGEAPPTGPEPPTPHLLLFHQASQGLWVTAGVLQRISMLLIEDDNVIRPSSALRSLVAALDQLLEMQVPPFADHLLAWHEATALLDNLAKRVAEDPMDQELAWKLDPVEADFDVVLERLAHIVDMFISMYGKAAANQVRSSFGELTVGEALNILAVLVERVVVKAPKWGPLSMRHPVVPRWWTPMPWAGWLRSTLRQLADQMADQAQGATEPLPPEVPFSAGGM